ncbi:MAG TPA: DUF1853 family protein, partial [Halomonas sp.]|nr:DUF1853 family protein [Halomonas sp.]
MPQPLTTAQPDHWQHPLVRDLAWLIDAPDLLQLDNVERPSLEELGLDAPQVRQRFLYHLDISPEPLGSQFGETFDHRLGLYHERLWQRLLALAPGTRLLAHNLPVIEAQRTLGELDLLYTRRDSGLPIHLEVTIKYYLGLPDGPGAADDQARWIGPGGMDSLAIKRAHLQQHQLPMANTPQARDALASHLGVSPPGRMLQRLAMPGVLFYPMDRTLPAPRQANPRHLKGQWLRWRDWHRLTDRLPRGMRGAWLNRPHWLAFPACEQLVPLARLSHQLASHFA